MLMINQTDQTEKDVRHDSEGFGEEGELRYCEKELINK